MTTSENLFQTLRPVADRFKAIDEIYRVQGLATPVDVEDAWEKFIRVAEHAENELRSGLWEIIPFGWDKI